MITAEQVRLARKLVAIDEGGYESRRDIYCRAKSPRVTQAKKDWLKVNASTHTAKQCAEHLGCAINTVRLHALRLGVTLKSGVTYEREEQYA